MWQHRGREEKMNAALRLATPVGMMELSCLLRTIRRVPEETFPRSSVLVQKHERKELGQFFAAKVLRDLSTYFLNL